MEEKPISLAPVPAGVRSPALPDDMVQIQHPVFHARTQPHAPTLRDMVAVIFRHRTLVLTVFAMSLLGVVGGTLLVRKQYEASMKILVKRERIDPVLAPASNVPSGVAPEVTQEDINSEVQILKSRDLLEKVVVACKLDARQDPSILQKLLDRVHLPGSKPAGGPDPRIPAAVLQLEQKLSVDPVLRSKMIEVTYSSEDPELSARVLQTLSGLYLEKHLAVHRPPGALDFFQRQTEQSRKELEEAQTRMAEFSQSEGVVSVDLEKDSTLHKLSAFESQLKETAAAKAAIEQRIKSLQTQAAATPARVVTQVKNSDNPYLLQQLKSTILNLELKRTELLTKYEPGYRAVQEVDAQIAQAREALSQAEKNGLRDETTDLDKTRQWLDEELAKARAEAVTLLARYTELAKTVEQYRNSAQQFTRREVVQSDLARSVKTAEENYLLYQRKQEEARISDALDRNRMVNVALAEAPTVPALPSGPRRSVFLMLGLVLSAVVSIGLAFGADSLDSTFKTPVEVENLLGLPVVASFPRS